MNGFAKRRKMRPVRWFCQCFCGRAHCRYDGQGSCFLQKKTARPSTRTRREPGDKISESADLPNPSSGRMLARRNQPRSTMKRKIEFASHPANLSSVRNLVRQFALDARLPAGQVDLVVLGVDEACSNVIRHVYREETRLIGLSCEQLETGVRFHIRDYG